MIVMLQFPDTRRRNTPLHGGEIVDSSTTYSLSTTRWDKLLTCCHLYDQ